MAAEIFVVSCREIGIELLFLAERSMGLSSVMVTGVDLVGIGKRINYFLQCLKHGSRLTVSAAVDEKGISREYG